MFLAVSFAGVWLARSGQRRSQKLAAALVMGIAVLGAAAIKRLPLDADRGEMGSCGEGTVTKNMTNRIKGLAFPCVRTASQFQITQTPRS